MQKLLLLVSALLLSAFSAAAQTTTQLNLMPMPAKIQQGSGQLVIDQRLTVAMTGAKDPRLNNGVSRFLDDLSRQTGMPLSAAPADSAKATLVIAN